MTTNILNAPMFQRFVNLLAMRQKSGKPNWLNRFGILVVFISVCAGAITYGALTDRPLISDRIRHFYWLLGVDIVLLCALVAVVAWRSLRVWQRRQNRVAGAQLHIRLMAIFSAFAAVPAIFVAVFAVIFIHVSVQSWFGTEIRTAVDESESIAQAYLSEHQQSIKADTLAMANDLNRESLHLLDNPKFLSEFFKTQVYLRNLSEAVLIDSNGHVVERGGLSFSLEFLSSDPSFKNMVAKAENGDVVMSVGENTDRVRALVKLDNYVDTYLFVGRFVDEKVLARISATTRAADAYQALEQQQAGLKRTMTVIFALVALMLLLVAIWAGLALADRLVDPVSRLVQAAERIRTGDLNAHVEEKNGETEIGVLARAFNRMTEQLRAQRRDLMNANRQLDERRRFSETVLAGVNAGVLGMDDKGVIQVANGSAQRLFGKDVTAIVGRKLLELCPEMEKLRRVLRGKVGRSVEAPVDLNHIDDTPPSHWIVRMTAEGQGDDLRGYVATFDDLSPLMEAQRKAAWADVARRVAHEIKNPLTPIQLSAERLKRRYSKQISDDVETFDTCIETIIRHVDDIRHMVDEFSAFARMPAVSRKTENMVTLCQQILVLFQQAHKNVQFSFDRPEQPVMLSIDRSQIGQALTNLVKNAFEAVQEKKETDPYFAGWVKISLTETTEAIILSVTDNGPGLPVDLLPRLTEPYVTTKATGNGLGLAIISKIAEDHNAKLDLANTSDGATARLIFTKEDPTHG